MDTGELKDRLGRILAEEEADRPVDWLEVERMSDDLMGELKMPVPLIVDEYLRGSERRRQDGVFGNAQRVQLLQYLKASGTPML